MANLSDSSSSEGTASGMSWQRLLLGMALLAAGWVMTRPASPQRQHLPERILAVAHAIGLFETHERQNDAGSAPAATPVPTQSACDERPIVVRRSCR